MIKEYKECILRKTYDFRNFKELQEFQFLVSRFLKIFTNLETLLSTLSPWSIAPSLPLPCAAVPFVWRAEPACYEIPRVHSRYQSQGDLMETHVCSLHLLT